MLCVHENNILRSVISVINRNNMEQASLMFDGLMIYGNHYSNSELLTEIEIKDESDFNGLNMKFSYKEHTINNEEIV